MAGGEICHVVLEYNLIYNVYEFLVFSAYECVSLFNRFQNRLECPKCSKRILKLNMTENFWDLLALCEVIYLIRIDAVYLRRKNIRFVIKPDFIHIRIIYSEFWNTIYFYKFMNKHIFQAWSSLYKLIVSVRHFKKS